LAYACLVETFDAWRELMRMAAFGRSEREQLAIKLALQWRSPFMSLTFEAWQAYTKKNMEIKKRAAYAIGPGRILHMVMRTWAHNVREQVKQNEREWVVGLMEETLPTMIGAALEQELKPQLEQKQSEVDGGLTRLMSTTAAIQSELARLRKEMKTTNARKVKEQENLAHRIVRQWRHTHISRALQAWKEVVAQSRHLLERAAHHWRTMPLHYAMEVWAHYVENLHHLQRVAKLIGSRLGSRMTSQIIAAWRAVVLQSLGLRKDGTARAVAMWKNIALTSTFYPWANFVRRSIRVKQLSRNALVRMQQHAAAVAFEALAAHVQEAKTTRHALLKNAAQRLIGHTRLRVLHAWHSYTRECVTERQGVYAKAVRRFFNRQLSIALEAWREFVELRRVLLRRAAFHFGDGYVMMYCFGKWREIWRRVAEAKKTEWLLQDLKVVGPGWLVQTLDQLITSSLPEASELRANLSRALALAGKVDSSEAQGGAALSDAGGSLLHGQQAVSTAVDMQQMPQTVMPHPPAGPRAAQPAAPVRHNVLSKQNTTAHEQSSSSLRAGSPELTPPDCGPDLLTAQAPQSSMTIGLPSSGEPRSVALLALGEFFESHQRKNNEEVQHVYEVYKEANANSSKEVERLTSDVYSLRELQLEHARLAYAEASKRQSDAVSLDQRVNQLTSKLSEVDERMAFLKETLYSVLTPLQGGPIKAPSSKKVLKPIKPPKATPFDAAFDPVAL